VRKNEREKGRDVIPCSEHCNFVGDTICGDVSACGMLQLLDSGDMSEVSEKK
jgi:hypothetical protein